MGDMFDNKLIWIVILIIIIIVIIVLLRAAQNKEDEQPGMQNWVMFTIIAIVAVIIGFILGWYLKSRMTHDPITIAINGVKNGATKVGNVIMNN